MHMADSSIFISCAMSLAVFDISKCVENGKVIEPVHENTTGTIRSISLSLSLSETHANFQSPKTIQMLYSTTLRASHRSDSSRRTQVVRNQDSVILGNFPQPMYVFM